MVQALFSEAPAPEEDLVVSSSKMSVNRKSRRLLDLEPKSDDEVPPTKTRELKSLLAKGGRRGAYDPAHDDWNYFPEAKRVKSMIDISALEKEIEQIKKFAETQDEEMPYDSTYRLLHVNQISQAVSHRCKTCDEDNQGKRVSDKKVNFKTYGMASSINLTCMECQEDCEVPPNPSTFAGTGYDGEPSARKNNSWFEANLRFVLATLAVGNGGQDLGDFAAFLDLPQASSFATRPFNKIESIVGEHLRRVAEESMIEAWEQETEATLVSEGKDYKTWQDNQPSEREKVKLTVSFDMGWQKRSSGNRYDSLSSHALMIGARFKK